MAEHRTKEGKPRIKNGHVIANGSSEHKGEGRANGEKDEKKEKYKGGAEKKCELHRETGKHEIWQEQCGDLNKVDEPDDGLGAHEPGVAGVPPEHVGSSIGASPFLLARVDDEFVRVG